MGLCLHLLQFSGPTSLLVEAATVMAVWSSVAEDVRQVCQDSPQHTVSFWAQGTEWVRVGRSWPGVGSQAQQGPDTAQGFRRALVFLCATALLRDVLAQSEGAFVFISTQCPALVYANPLFSQVYKL